MPVDPASLVIVSHPHPALRRKATTVDPMSDDVRVVAERMLDLTREADGLGLACPQVGLSWRMFVTIAHEDAPDRIFINPILSGPSADTESREEGCLSLPNIHVEVKRPIEITITATDLAGATFTLTSDELPARVWQHEIDHLNGVLIIDRMGPMDRLANRKAIKELERAAKE